MKKIIEFLIGIFCLAWMAVLFFIPFLVLNVLILGLLKEFN